MKNLQKFYFDRKNVTGEAFAGLYEYELDDYNDIIYEDVGSFVQVRQFLEKDIKIHPGIKLTFLISSQFFSET